MRVRNEQLGLWAKSRLSARTRIWRNALQRPVLWAVPIIIGIYVVFSYIRNELPIEWQNHLRISAMIPHWPWYGWVIAGLVTLLVLFMEGSYRVIRDLERARSDAERRAERRND